MSASRYSQDDQESTHARVAPFATPGRVPVSARLFPGALMRKARDSNGVAEGADEAVAQASSASGSPLPGDVRERFESSLGADLSAVRVHTGADSVAAASAVGAKAYAVGNDIHFNEGNYAPADPFGLHLLAHEVAHTQQQAGGTATPQYKLEVSSAGDAAEVEADRAADAMVSGAAAIVGGSSGLHRWSIAGAEKSLDKGLDTASRAVIAGKMQTAAGTAQANQATINSISDACTAQAQQATRILTKNANNYNTAYGTAQAVMGKADKNAARQKAIKEAVQDAIIGAAFTALLGPGGPLLAGMCAELEESAAATKGMISKLALKGMGKAIDKGSEAGIEALKKGATSDHPPEESPSDSMKGATSAPAEKFSQALNKVNDIMGSIPRMGAQSTAATSVMGAAMELASDAHDDSFTVADLTEKSDTVSTAAAKTTADAGKAGRAKTTVNQLTGPATSLGEHSVAEIEGKLWKQWMASLTGEDSKHMLKDKDIHAHLKAMGLVGDNEDPDESVATAQKEFLKAHGVTPPSEDPDVIQSLYRREMKRDEVMKRMVGKTGPVIEGHRVQMDGIVWRFDANAQVGDVLRCLGAVSIHADSVTIVEWSDQDFSLGCIPTGEHAGNNVPIGAPGSWTPPADYGRANPHPTQQDD